MSTRFVRNPGFERELRASPGVQAFMNAATVAAADEVREKAPHATGYYKRRVRAQGDRVVTLDPFWHLVEFGSANNPTYAPLRRGIRAAGLRLAESPKK